MRHKITLIISLLFLASSVSYAGIYKWTDEQGNVHYSQTKPSNQKTESLRIKSHAPENKSTYKRPSLKTKDADETSTNGNAQAENNNESSPEKDADLCKRSKADLQVLMSRGRIRQKMPDGTVVYMTDEQKQERIEANKKRIKNYCK